MSGPVLQTVAQFSVERILNALPEGFLIALLAWALLRVFRRQNSGTRFAVWFLALLTVAALPALAHFGEARAVIGAAMPSESARPAITIPAGWALFAFLAWALGAGVAMFRLAAGLWRLRGLRRSCTPIDAANLDPTLQRTLLQSTLYSISQPRSGLGSVTVATSEHVRVPAAIGFWKRTIVLPAWTLRELPPEDLNVILLHEFAHLRRGDDWTNLIQKIVRALFFFHPAVWWIEHRLEVEREMACDDAVLAETANPHGYANCLVSLLEKSVAHRLTGQSLTDKRWSMVQAAVHRTREAALRLAQILDTNRPVATRVWKPALAMTGVLSVASLALLLHAPQFIAFDRSQSRMPAVSSHPYSAALSQPSFQSLLSTGGEPVVPARRDGRDAHRSITRPHVHAVVGRRLASPQPVAARWNLASPPERLVEASADTNRETLPQTRTLVFFEATEYVTSDSSVWRVQVWRVTVVSAVRERLARVPVAKST